MPIAKCGKGFSETARYVLSRTGVQFRLAIIKMIDNNPIVKTKAALLVLSIAMGMVFQSCKNDDPTVPKSELIVPKIEDILNGNDQDLINLLNNVRGSVGTRGPGSKTIWSRKNQYELGLYISANHVYNLSGWNSRNAQFFDPATENLGIFETSQIPPDNGDIALGNTLIADFPLMHFDISANATNTTIVPAEDFYLGILDNQRTAQGPLPQHPDFLQTDQPLQQYDPVNRTKADQTWNDPVAGENAIAVGYPQDRGNYPNGAVAYGKILSDAAAAECILQLKAAGDVEGDIPYDPGAEFFVASQAVAGMSGGGVFDEDGKLLGIMVRSSDTEGAPKIIRVVKVAYIRAKMLEFYQELPETIKHKIHPFISGELD